jgi:hypothetical protein
MANIRVIPLEEDTTTLEQLAILNTLILKNPESSLWVKNSEGDLVVGSAFFSRSGSWATKIATDTVDTPPLVEWKYDATADNDAVVSITNDDSRANIKVGNLEVVPMPSDNFPDTYWVRNGQDIIPRS